MTKRKIAFHSALVAIGDPSKLSVSLETIELPRTEEEVELGLPPMYQVMMFLEEELNA